MLLIGIVLLQQGKGADAGATFGGGGNTFFGASGADNFLTRTTTIIAIAFMCTSFLLARGVRDTSTATDGSLLGNLPQAEQHVAPAQQYPDGARPLIPLTAPAAPKQSAPAAAPAAAESQPATGSPAAPEPDAEKK